jgi:hypothetical protein
MLVTINTQDQHVVRGRWPIYQEHGQARQYVVCEISIMPGTIQNPQSTVQKEQPTIHADCYSAA